MAQVAAYLYWVNVEVEHSVLTAHLNWVKAEHSVLMGFL